MRKYMHEIVVERCANVATAILRREHEPGKVHVYLVIIPTISENEQKNILFRLFMENKQNNANCRKPDPRGCLDTPSGFVHIITYYTQIVKNKRSHYW